jgi:hypothetical protein
MQQLKSPDVRQLRKAVETIDEIIDAGYDVRITMTEQGDETETLSVISEQTLVVWRDALEWAYVYLMNRRDYHKGRSVKLKTEMTLLEEALRAKGHDVDAIKRQAHAAADETIIDNDDDA